LQHRLSKNLSEGERFHLYATVEALARDCVQTMPCILSVLDDTATIEPNVARKTSNAIRYAQDRDISDQYNRNDPVTWSMRDFGAGPIPNTVAEPAAICVLPASRTTLAVKERDKAVACNINSSSSEPTWRVTLACPPASQR
jgi:hypothetical protein